MGSEGGEQLCADDTFCNFGYLVSEGVFGVLTLVRGTMEANVHESAKIAKQSELLMRVQSLIASRAKPIIVD